MVIIMATKEEIIEVLKQCFDPEIPVDVWNLGLVYDLQIGSDGVIKVLMTLTAPGCGMGPMIAADVKEKIQQIKGVKEAHVEMTFDPPWSPDKMTDEAKAKLGML